ncbi:MAG: uL15 family ribosomal protein [Candidatus Sungbacteria bacterium]|nr:uL15 family ribosomal protein [bacterium]MDZ4260439.1 uL15 family ribosomal protein [Candidatus Sungbacteria bacterium]
MQVHQLTRTSHMRKSRRIGRGGKRGTFSGKGIKGQKSRAGAKIRPALRDILKKIPKLRGYRFKSFRLQPVTVTVLDIEKKFTNGDTVSPETLLKAKLIRRAKGKMPKVKILGKGKFTKKFIFKDVLFSESVAHAVSGKSS